MNETPVIPKLLKAGEVAQVLRVSRTSAYRLIQSGELPSVRFGPQTVRVREDDLAKFINGSGCNASDK